MDKKKLHKIKASLHKFANETHNTLGPEKKREQYMAHFCQQLERHEHAYKKEELIDVPPEDLKKKKKKEEPKEEEKKKKDKKSKKDEEEHIDSSKTKSKKGSKKEEVTEDIKDKLDKTKKKTTDKKKAKPQENKENIELGELIPDITVTDSDFKCVIDITAKKHMEKKDKLYAEKYEKYLKSPAFIINFGKKTGPVVKYWKNIKKLKYT